MAGAELSNSLNTLARIGVVGDLSDGQLLQRFLAERDEAAQAVFTVLVERHGPMVLRISREVLDSPHDAQDVFQATFLVLARKAASVRKEDSLASWLYGVALRVAVRAKADAARRRVYERRVAAGKEEAAAERQGPAPESWPELHEEIARLPGRYRDPIVLCYLEGLTTEAAALRIGCPKGTVLSRLSRGRERLRARLTRRGLALPAALLAPGLVAEPTAAALLHAAVRASLAFAERRAEATSASAATITLAKGILHAMTLAKLKTVGAALLACALAIGGVRTFAQFGGGGRDQTPAGESPTVEAQQPSAALGRAIDKLQAVLDESARKNADLRKELNQIRAQIKMQPATAPQMPVTKEIVTSKVPIESKRPTAATQADGGPGTSSGGPGPLDYVAVGSSIVGISPERDQLVIFHTDTKGTEWLRLPEPKGVEGLTTDLEQSSGLWFVRLKGGKINQIAVADTRSDALYKQDLREAVDATVMPILILFSQTFGRRGPFRGGRHG